MVIWRARSNYSTTIAQACRLHYCASRLPAAGESNSHRFADQSRSISQRNFPTKIVAVVRSLRLFSGRRLGLVLESLTLQGNAQRLRATRNVGLLAKPLKHHTRILLTKTLEPAVCLFHYCNGFNVKSQLSFWLVPVAFSISLFCC